MRDGSIEKRTYQLPKRELTNFFPSCVPANTFERDSPSAVIANKIRRLLSEAETSGSESGMDSATVSTIMIVHVYF